MSEPPKASQPLAANESIKLALNHLLGSRRDGVGGTLRWRDEISHFATT
jgi:hypothetical protein